MRLFVTLLIRRVVRLDWVCGGHFAETGLYSSCTVASKVRHSRSQTRSHSRTSYSNNLVTLPPSTPNHPHAPLPDRATSHSEESFFPLAKVAKIRPCSSEPTSSATCTRNPCQNDQAHATRWTYGTEYMLVFAKVAVKGHVSEYALDRVRTRQPGYLPVNSLGTSVHCRILENFTTPDLYAVGGFGPGGLALDCWARFSKVDLCRVDRSDLWILRALTCILGRSIVS